MLLYTLMDEEIAGNAADAMGLTTALGFRPSRICVPLDAGSLAASWTRMAAASPMVGDYVEILGVDDADAVPVDAVCLRRALARASRDDDPEPDPATVQGMLGPEEPACTDYALPERFKATLRLRIPNDALVSGDLTTDWDARQAVRKAVQGVGFLARRYSSARASLMLTGAAPFVWGLATRTDLSPDILSVGVFDLPDTEGVSRALELRRQALGERADRGAYLAAHAAFAEGLDELAHRLAERRAKRTRTSDTTSCFCGSGHPFAVCCKARGLDGIARAW